MRRENGANIVGRANANAVPVAIGPAASVNIRSSVTLPMEYSIHAHGQQVELGIHARGDKSVNFWCSQLSAWAGRFMFYTTSAGGNLVGTCQL
jgi:hypothetical protein